MTASRIVTPGELYRQAEMATAVLRALANPQRLRLACALLAGERGVGELEGLTGIRQPVLSKELGKLRDSGLIEGRRESKAVFYRLIDDRVEGVIAALCGRSVPSSGSGSSLASQERGSIFAKIVPCTG